MTDKRKVTDKDLLAADSAMQRAALAARRIAIATNTPIAIWENGKIVEKRPGDKGW
jgi:hypothetical protein